MKLSIRTRLTLLITLVFFVVLVLVLVSGGVALYVSLNEELDKSLIGEKKSSLDLMDEEYVELTSAAGTEFDTLREELDEDLHDLYDNKRQFSIFAIHRAGEKLVIRAGGEHNLDRLIHQGDFLSNEDGFYNLHIEGRRYRAHVTQHEWGVQIVGMPNQIFYEIADEIREMLLVGAPVTLVLVLLGGLVLARLSMKPVVAAAKATENISLKNLGNRLPEYAGKDEFGVLVDTLNLMISRIEDGVKRVRQFTQDAAHELRTPLTIQRGDVELLYQREDLPEDVREALRKTLDRVIYMSQIVDNLLLLAQTDAGNYPIQKEKFRLDQIISEVAEDAEILVGDRPISIHTDCDAVEFSGWAELLRRLVLNLADNAIKNTNRGRIDFRLKSSEKEVSLSVSDTGSGVSEEELPYIFDRFYQSDKARTSTKSGSGLGLAICQWIAHAHGGEIKVASELAKGTTVTVTFPAKNTPSF